MKKVQEQVYGLSLALDQSLDTCQLEAEQLAAMKYALWVFLYNMDKQMEYSNALMNVTMYVMDMNNFIALLPKEEFKQGAFIWYV